MANEVKRHPEHTGLKHFEMVERNFAAASRDTGDVPTRVTRMVPAYYYEGLLDKLAASANGHDALRAKCDALELHNRTAATLLRHHADDAHDEDVTEILRWLDAYDKRAAMSGKAGT